VNNVIRNNASYGIQIAAYGCYATSGQCAGPDYSGAVDWVIAHNTIAYEQNRSAIVVWLPDASYGTPLGTLSNVTIVDNVFYDNDTAKNGAPNGVAFVTFDGDATIAIRHNLFFDDGGAVDMDPNSAAVSSVLHGDPAFVNAAAFDFHLKAASPAIDVGEVVPGVDDDLDGVKRPQGPAVDLGAFERPVASPDAGTDVDAVSDAPTADAAFDASRADAETGAESSSNGSNDEGGCGCATAGRRDRVTPFSLLSLAALLAAMRLRSRAASPRPTTPPDPSARAARSRAARRPRARP